MDRQEAIQTLSKIGKISVSYAEDLFDSFFAKPVVPDFIAEWIEEAKNKQGYNVVGAVNNAPNGDIENWLILENVEIFTKAWVYGYEVEKEARYTVSIKAITDGENFLKKDKHDNVWYFGGTRAIGILHHTRKELEDADFGWVFDCPGVEVKEVTDE